MEAVPGSPASIIDLPDWVPTTSHSAAAPNQNNVRRRFRTEGESESAIGLLSRDTPDDDDDSQSASGTSHRLQPAKPSSRNGRPPVIDRRPVKHVIIPPDEDRIAKRQMTSWQLFVSLNRN